MKTGKTVLIVDDEIPTLMALHDKFSLEGFDILEAKDGQEGLHVATEKHPDLILLDIIMPIMDGITMLKELRDSGEWGKNANVIILSNLNDEEKVSEAMAHGTYEYLVKADWDIEDVVKKAKEKLGI
jgi:CheY-like chemotaxis protein